MSLGLLRTEQAISLDQADFARHITVIKNMRVDCISQNRLAVQKVL
jgi:hypothetical protein